jgi:hypothetical protein
MLVLGAEAEMALYAIDPQQLINAVNQKGGLSFLAHPDEEALRYFPDESITWQDWQVKNFTGLELWNWFSEIKSVSPTLSQFILNLISPEQIGTHPSPTTIDRWNRMLSEGKHISVIGGSDAHALPFKIGWMTKIIFPYLVHFTAVNNHILLPQKLSGDIEQDKKSIYSALAKGSSYISYDLPAPTRGFSFTISNDESIASLGDTLTIKRGATVQISLPSPAEIHLLKEGKRIYASQNNDRMAYPIVEPGAYRVECYRDYLGKKRGWIYSNPIYVVKEQLTDGSFK